MLNVEYVVISSPRARDCQCCVAAHGLWCPGVECSDSATSRQLSRLLSHCQHLLSCVSSSVIVNISSVVYPLQSLSTPPKLCILLSHCQHLISCVSSKVIVNNSSVVNPLKSFYTFSVVYPLKSLSTPPQLSIPLGAVHILRIYEQPMVTF